MQKIKPAICPLCLATLKYKAINNKDKSSLDKTHIYICKECPFIGLEFWQNVNIETLKNYLIKK